MRYGYMRVSTDKQDTDLQLDALRRAGVPDECIYRDVISGKTTSREGLDEVLGLLNPGDELVVWKLDRLGRSAEHLFRMVKGMKDRNIKFVSLMEGMDISTTTGWAMFQLMGVFAEMERNLISDRVRAAVSVKRKNHGGNWGKRPGCAYDPAEMVRMSGEGMSTREIGVELGVSHMTVARVLRNPDRWCNVPITKGLSIVP